MKFLSAARWLALGCCLAIAAHGFGQDLASPAHFLADFEKRVTVKVLPNGLTLIVCERPEAPVFSYFTIVDAGDVNDPGGQSGLAAGIVHVARIHNGEVGKDGSFGALADDQCESVRQYFDGDALLKIREEMGGAGQVLAKTVSGNRQTASQRQPARGR